MSFPAKPFADLGDYFRHYQSTMALVVASIDTAMLQKAGEVLEQAVRAGRFVFVCGNGGSAAIANHLVCDHMKGVQSDTGLRPRIVSLSSTIEMITAIANDISYDEVFAYQLKTLASAGDVLIAISSSGDSENIVRACSWAKENGLHLICFTGFTGGRSRSLADVPLHVNAANYGIVEDAHQMLMHVLAQFIRQKNMDADLVALRRF